MSFLKNRHLTILKKVSEITGYSVHECDKAVAAYCKVTKDIIEEIDIYNPESFPVLHFPFLYNFVPVKAKLDRMVDNNKELVDLERYTEIMDKFSEEDHKRIREHKKRLRERPNNIYNIMLDNFKERK